MTSPGSWQEHRAIYEHGARQKDVPAGGQFSGAT